MFDAVLRRDIGVQRKFVRGLCTLYKGDRLPHDDGDRCVVCVRLPVELLRGLGNKLDTSIVHIPRRRLLIVFWRFAWPLPLICRNAAIERTTIEHAK